MYFILISILEQCHFLEINLRFLIDRQIIKKMLDHSPKSRPTATSLIRSDLLDEGLAEIAEELLNVDDGNESDYSPGLESDLDWNEREQDFQ